MHWTFQVYTKLIDIANILVNYFFSTLSFFLSMLINQAWKDTVEKDWIFETYVLI